MVRSTGNMYSITNNNNNIYVFSAISSELKLSSEARVTTLHCLCTCSIWLFVPREFDGVLFLNVGMSSSF